jgi:hypothetical protein
MRRNALTSPSASCCPPGSFPNSSLYTSACRCDFISRSTARHTFNVSISSTFGGTQSGRTCEGQLLRLRLRDAPLEPCKGGFAVLEPCVILTRILYDRMHTGMKGSEAALTRFKGKLACPSYLHALRLAHEEGPVEARGVVADKSYLLTARHLHHKDRT